MIASADKITVDNVDFLVRRMINQAPRATFLRELVKNAEEAASQAKEQGEVRIYPANINGTRKLAIWNNGPGMSDAELRQAMNLSSSLGKEMGLQENFGVGAKVSGLAVSPFGLRYRSRSGNSVSQATVHWDNEARAYAVQRLVLEDGNVESVFDVSELDEIKHLPQDSDWTEVVLMGESETHDTVANPLGESELSERSYIATEVYRRFANLSDAVTVYVDVAMTKGGGRNETGRFRRVKTLQEVIDNWDHQHEVVSLQNGVAVRFIHDPQSGSSAHTASSRLNAAVGSTTFCALVHKGERYEFITQQKWAVEAPNYGISFGSKALTVEILLPEDMAIPDGYRTTLLHPDTRERIVPSDFAPFIAAILPEWVRDIVAEHAPKSLSDLSDIQSELQRMLDEYRVPTEVMRRLKSGDPVQNEGSGLPDTTGAEVSDEEDVDVKTDIPDIHDVDEPAESRQAKRASAENLMPAPLGAKRAQSSQALEKAPEIIILTEDKDIREKEISYRGARYYPDLQKLFVNGEYEAVWLMVDRLTRELQSRATKDVVLAACLEASRHSMALRIGKATCHGIRKRLIQSWSPANLETATSPEALSLAADDYEQSFRKAKAYAEKQIKILSLETDNVGDALSDEIKTSDSNSELTN